MEKVKKTQTLLKYTYGVAVLLIGLDKLLRTDLIVDWGKYVNEMISGVIPIGSFLLAIGIIEVAVAILLLSKWTRVAAYISAIWLVLIAVNLLMLGFVDIAARDLVLAVGAIALAWLTEAQRNIHPSSI